MEEFIEYVEKQGMEKIPEFYFGEDRMGYRFLQGMGWKYDKAAEAIKNHWQFYQATYPVDGTSCLPFLQSGSVYVAGRCKEGHQPIVIINMKKFID